MINGCRLDFCSYPFIEIGGEVRGAQKRAEVRDLVVEAFEGGRYVQNRYRDSGLPDLLDDRYRRRLGISNDQRRVVLEDTLGC